jgi:hypothetical protein
VAPYGCAAWRNFCACGWHLQQVCRANRRGKAVVCSTTVLAMAGAAPCSGAVLLLISAPPRTYGCLDLPLHLHFASSLTAFLTVVAVWGVTVALVAASALLLLDVVGIILPGVGLTVHPVAVLSRAACLAGSVLVGATALSYQRHWRSACLACGRTGETVRPARPPRWARLAAWAAVAGCLARLLAQALVGFGSGRLRAGGSLLLFEAGFLLAGTVLPLALVCRWGRVFPGWVPLAGRPGCAPLAGAGPGAGARRGNDGLLWGGHGAARGRDGDRHLGAGRRVASIVVFLGCHSRVPGLGPGARRRGAGLPARDPPPMPDLRPLIAEPPTPLRGPRAAVRLRPARAACAARRCGRTPSSRRPAASAITAAPPTAVVSGAATPWGSS